MIFPPEPLLRARRMNIKWIVANTDKRPIDCDSVNILLSVDDGATFPYSLSSQTDNDGSELVDIPLFGQMPMRILIESAVGNFFAISSRFRVMPSDTTISFVPRTAGDPVIDANMAGASFLVLKVPAGIGRCRAMHRVGRRSA